MKKEIWYFKTFLVAGILVFCLTATSYAQVEHRLTLNAGAGFTPLVGRITNSLNNSWGVSVGGECAFTNHFETNLQLGYNALGIDHSVLVSENAPGGSSHLWSITVDPELRMGRERAVDPYVVGG